MVDLLLYLFQFSYPLQYVENPIFSVFYKEPQLNAFLMYSIFKFLICAHFHFANLTHSVQNNTELSTGNPLILQEFYVLLFYELRISYAHCILCIFNTQFVKTRIPPPLLLQVTTMQ